MPAAEAPPMAPPAAAPSPAPTPASPATDLGPGTEIHVTPATVDKGPQAPPPKKGSAMDRLMGDLRKKAKPNFYESDPAPTPDQNAPGSTPSTEPKSDAPPTADAGHTPDPASAPKPGDKTAAPPAKGEKNPWKLVDSYKARSTQAEARIAELEKSMPQLKELETIRKDLEAARKANEDLEKEIKYTNYAKSAEFKAKYQEPYEKAWHRAVKELTGIQVSDPNTGEPRAMDIGDLANVVNLPLGEAKLFANKVFGEFSNEAMAYRKEIQALYEAQQGALNDARENAVKREKEAQEQSQRQMGETAEFVKKVWDQANAEFTAKPDVAFVFKPAEGDTESKARLDNGYKLVDEAFSLNSADPNMTPQQRERAVKMHAAVRMRAAGFGVVKHLYDGSLKKIAALEKELSEYRQTTPGTGGTSGAATPPAEGKAWDRIRAGLQKIAKPS